MIDFKVRTVQKNIVGYTRQLKRAGFKELGTGAFAVVLHHANPNVVVKVAQIEGAPPDDGYLAYLKEVVKYQHNPMVPKVYSVDVVRFRNDNYWDPYTVTVLEKLKELPHNRKSDKLAELVSDICHLHDHRDKYAAALISPALVEIAPVIKKLQNRGFSEDLHGGNLMIRPSDNSLVITDPFCGR